MVYYEEIFNLLWEGENANPDRREWLRALSTFHDLPEDYISYLTSELD